MKYFFFLQNISFLIYLNTLLPFHLTLFCTRCTRRKLEYKSTKGNGSKEPAAHVLPASLVPGGYQLSHGIPKWRSHRMFVTYK